MRLLLPVLLAVVLASGGCADDPRTALEDEASCPGATCTDDTRDRRDAIASLDRVNAVVSVSRDYGLDSGSVAEAEVDAAVDDRDAAYAVGEAVLGVLDAWPDREFSVALATVTADPAVEVDYVAEQSEDLTNPYFKACSPQDCRAALDGLRDRVLNGVDGMESVDLRADQGTLRITGTASPDRYALAAAGIRSLVFDLALRLADRLEVRVTARGPLVLTLRLDDGLVCEQRPGMQGCPEDEMRPFHGS